MTRRTRSFLVDNTLGKIFTGVKTTSEGTPDKLIAGTKLSVKTLAGLPKAIVVPLQTLSGEVWFGANGALITRVEILVNSAPIGQPLIIGLRRGLRTDPAGQVQFATHSLAENSRYASHTVAHQIPAGQGMWVSVIQSGTFRRAVGLTVRFSYYGA